MNNFQLHRVFATSNEYRWMVLYKYGWSVYDNRLGLIADSLSEKDARFLLERID